jgi:hypothetical protein
VVCLLLTALLARCHTSLRCNLGAPRWIKPTKVEATVHTVPDEKRAWFELMRNSEPTLHMFQAVLGTVLRPFSLRSAIFPDQQLFNGCH